MLSREASQKLLRWLRPRLVLSTPELEGQKRPSSMLGSLTPTEYALAKCYRPFEDRVPITYCGAAGFLVVLLLFHFGLLDSPFLFVGKLLRKWKTL